MSHNNATNLFIGLIEQSIFTPFFFTSWFLSIIILSIIYSNNVPTACTRATILGLTNFSLIYVYV